MHADDSALQLAGPTIDLVAEGSRRVLGCGLESKAISVTQRSASGQPAPTGTLVQLSLTPAEGSLEPTTLTLVGAEPGATTFRSQGSGSVTIHATVGGAPAGTVTLIVAAPVALLIAAVIGGVMGGWLARFQESKLRPRRRRLDVEEPPGEPRLWIRLLVGVLCGVILETAIAFDVVHMAISKTLALTWLGAWLIGCVGGYIGPAVLDLVPRAKRWLRRASVPRRDEGRHDAAR